MRHPRSIQPELELKLSATHNARQPILAAVTATDFVGLRGPGPDDVDGQRLRRSAPAPGRPLTSEAARWSRPVLEAEVILTSALANLEPSGSLMLPALVQASAQLMTPPRRAARRLIASWLVGVLGGQLDSTSSLLDAEKWFTGETSVSLNLTLDATRRVHQLLSTVTADEDALEMLPYALDPLPHEYRRDLLFGKGSGASRVARKARGSFFTPSDVAEHMVALVLDQVDVHAAGFRLLDPAAGTGVFLRSAFSHLLRRGVPPPAALASLYAIDLDECCADMSAFVLLADLLAGSSECSADSLEVVWADIRGRVLAGDTLSVFTGVLSRESLFEGTRTLAAWRGGPFTAIVGNPPYARIGSPTRAAALANRFSSLVGTSSSGDIYPAFVELLCSSLALDGAGCLVVPMSVAYSSANQLRRLRTLASQTSGQWIFEFYDRTPDAMFGDDVKQRTAIVTRLVSEPSSLTTSHAMRWTSRNRCKLFSRIPRVDLGQHDFSDCVPKLGSKQQKDAYRLLREQSQLLSLDLVSTRKVPLADAANAHSAAESGATLYVAGTAYNWLSIYRDLTLPLGDEQLSSTPLHGLTFRSAWKADVAYGILVSRLSYWLWRVESDLFHVPAHWLANLPVSVDSVPNDVAHRLRRLGRSLWSEIVQHPVVSLNSGKRTVSYCPNAEASILDQIDHELISMLDLPPGFGSELASFVRGLAAAGRESQDEHGLRRAFASWRETTD